MKKKNMETFFKQNLKNSLHATHASYSVTLKRHGELKHKKRKARTDEVVPVPENPKKIKTAFYCEECNYRCAWKHNLKRHIQLTH